MITDFKIILLAIYSISSAIGLSLLKYFPLLSAQGLLGGVLYGGAFLFWILYLIKLMPLSSAFPIASGMIVVALFLVTSFIEKTFSYNELIGSFIIVLGIGVTSYSTNS